MDNKVLNIRPMKLMEFIGNEDITSNLEIFIKAALIKKKTLDHILLYGPAGLGKTTLANIVANELKVNFIYVNAPTLEKPRDLIGILSNIKENDVLFIDEIHRLPKVIEELLYSAMEDFKINIKYDNGTRCKTIVVDITPFTLIGATTKSGLLSKPFRDRFPITLKMEYYSVLDMEKIIARSSKLMGLKIDTDALHDIAIRSRNTPRIGNNLLKRVYDFALVDNVKCVNKVYVDNVFDKIRIDCMGLNSLDITYLKSIINHGGGPVGISTISSMINEDIETIESMIEPYLIKEGFIKRTKRGRIVTSKTYEHVK